MGTPIQGYGGDDKPIISVCCKGFASKKIQAEPAKISDDGLRRLKDGEWGVGEWGEIQCLAGTEQVREGSSKWFLPDAPFIASTKSVR